MLAVAALIYHGKPAWLMDIRALPSDQDHIVTLFKEHGLWGAISKTNHAVLRWRDPIYASVRELMMSYAHEYNLDWRQEIDLLIAAVLAHTLCAGALVYRTR